MIAPEPSRLLQQRSLEEAVRALQDAASRLGQIAIPPPEHDAVEDAALFIHTTDGRTLVRR